MNSNIDHPVLISIIVPTYNRATIIHRAVNSIKEQIFKQWECIIVDDHSTDNTDEVIAELTKGDSRFSYIKNTRKKGAPGARNTGILSSVGNYIVLFDSDNIMHPEFLKKVYSKLKSDAANICGSFSAVINESSGKKISSFTWEGYGSIHKELLMGKCYFDNSSTLIEKQKLFDIGLLDEDCPSFQEWDTHIRLSAISTYTTLKEELVDYYRGGDDTISKSVERAVKGRLYILSKFNGEFKSEIPFFYFIHCLGVYIPIKERLDKNKYTYYYNIYLGIAKKHHYVVRGLYMLRKLKRLLLKRG